jgi:predicted nucleotidyltransferase
MATKHRSAILKGPLGEALRAVAIALSELPVPGMLIGGMAVIARGVARLTRDVDATVAAGDLDTRALADELAKHGLVPRIEDAVDFANTRQVLLLRHEASEVDIDVSLAWLPFELEAIAAADSVDLGGISIRVARAEDLIIYKTVAFRPQDQQDIERLLTLHGGKIDLDRIRRIVNEFAQAIDEPERLAAFERIVNAVLD